ncbi:dolichyl-phosphate-mannose--protein mannosyltransferase [Hylemonella gracilis]|uniref:Sulfatase n=1 Tax=Hylemonella gracilis ATCC 19624 TaxID=887062 RepID=F3KSD0_9BURK|nr:hypothetical protein [Hylemonella gracilis]EGI77324.1 sulfatase [Hylemonella gracilis ATCC 19624]
MKLQKFTIAPFDLVSAAIISTSIVMLLLLAFRAFDAAAAIVLGTLLTSTFYFSCVKSIRWPSRTSWGVVLALGLAALSLRLHPGLYVWGGQDEGLYVNISSYVERTGSLAIKDELREALPVEARAYYDKYNFWKFKNAVPDQHEGTADPGVYIKDLNTSQYVFQFYPLHSLWLAAASTIAGPDNRAYAAVVFSLLNILVLGLIAFELSGRRLWAGGITAALLATNTMHVFLAGFPLSESLVTFLLASTLYFLLCYWKQRNDGQRSNHYLLFSLGCWLCLTFTHISAFLFLPILGLIALSLVVAARDATEARTPALYFMLVLVTYCLSLLYGLTYSFPYTYDTFRAILGPHLGSIYLDHSPLIFAIATLTCAPIFRAAWKYRTSLREWAEKHGIVTVRYITSGLLLLVTVYCCVIGYRLAFTDVYAANEYLQEYQLPHQGLNSLSHVSLFALMLYISPMVLVLAALYVVRGSRIAAWSGAVFLLTLAWITVLRTVADDPIIPYYYFGRYLSTDAVPIAIIAAALAMATGLDHPKRWIKIGTWISLLFCLAWNLNLLAIQGGQREMAHLDASFKPLMRHFGDEDLVLLDMPHKQYMPLRTALRYYYGKRAVFIHGSDGEIRNFIQSIPKRFLAGNIYILSTNISKPTQLAAENEGIFTLKLSSHYRGEYDVLPMGNVGQDLSLHLFKLNFSEISTLSRHGRILFGGQGHSDWYVGEGWSGAEPDARWTEGDGATLNLPLAPGRYRLRFSLAGLKTQSVNVSVNGILRTTWRVSELPDGYKVYELNIQDADTTKGRVDIRLETPMAISPAEISTSQDTRKLGVMVKSIDVD